MAEFPNECWQADVTHVEVADGVVYEVLNIIDDHSRLCVASKMFVTTRAPDVVRTLHKAAATWGYPQRLLTDNGRIFTTPPGSGVGALAAELLSLGIATRHGKPYHPQTQGKVERFHQTLKKYLAKQDPATTKKLLQGQLNRFGDYYNTERPIAASDAAGRSRLGTPTRRRDLSVRASRRRAIGSATTRWTTADR